RQVVGFGSRAIDTAAASLSVAGRRPGKSASGPTGGGQTPTQSASARIPSAAGLTAWAKRQCSAAPLPTAARRLTADLGGHPKSRRKGVQYVGSLTSTCAPRARQRRRVHETCRQT